MAPALAVPSLFLVRHRFAVEAGCEVSFIPLRYPSRTIVQYSFGQKIRIATIRVLSFIVTVRAMALVE